MIKPIAISDFLLMDVSVPLIDVRTPAEFEHGHIPGAFNQPLFSNEERIKVGTAYKQVGREEAILLGFDLTGSKWSGFIKEALIIAPDKKIGVHCWRGGMRSGAMAWALDLYGFDVYLIQGGYKKYRIWVHLQFEERYQLQILGGMTGSGKTKLLLQLRSVGEQVIDLEELAQHQGSSYGSMNKMIQPTQEQFENNLAGQLKALDLQKKVWVEDESLTIGKRSIPNPFWHQMREAAIIDIKVGLQLRVNALAAEYGCLDKDFLMESTERIRKRLGPEQTKFAIEAIMEGRMKDFVKIVLVYYDKTYRTGLSKRDASKVVSLDLADADIATQANHILNSTINAPAT
ncbi:MULTISPECIES: tRNA 2-selenouridine(34) synthase MnmH [unclassified Mucilaginibacter]|uniref:tRNA 2-selenouridine(34) synthase MnmH n=1 Tax=unclassified Mucilaginibacter TaxID=2617802 RepID=UPI002AC93A3F|nr:MULTISPECIES: tRNA 2-selenouridine(34) synthase MnmH [unclassified Mucilaginibacter]MEB0260349.1 tRNA 2-selenouridine(34) synthase MnmH [Mucilaginibacter sp. 10I4]MEB0279389.1 tRNA 2-selenouridine(34) synthase MnmH [Mucilaginibacter sp. 10B2]MEB0300516.1 tRNA 2-selenouridine(34) synthase MnmH [Mucilaginibacter sp. 5C4]WPX21762.1 tRNA 2-selenouridine(34) synthase MnmH [Mucilaginibacter sp. 5C4]